MKLPYIVRLPPIWFLTYCKIGSADMPAVPSAILMFARAFTTSARAYIVGCQILPYELKFEIRFFN